MRAHYERRPHGRPMKFTPEAFTLVEAWVAWGFDRVDIARRLDTTVRSLESQCSIHHVKLNPSGAFVPRDVLDKFKDGSVAFNERPAAAPAWRQEPTVAMTIRPRQSSMRLLQVAALRRGEDTAALIARIVDATARDNLIDAVLDDAEPSSAPAVNRVDASA